MYGDKPVLEDVSLAVEPQRCMAIVGESGAGKTTLARCIVGLHSNWSGTIEFDGKPLAHDHRKRPTDAVRSLQYVFQNPYTSLNPRKTVGRLIEQPLRAAVQAPGAPSANAASSRRSMTPRSTRNT